MKAVGLYRYLPASNPESLLDLTIDDPEPRGRDLLVRVRAVSVNPVDTKVRAPKDTVEKEPKILGWDAAGVVEATGEDVERFTVGDEVYYAGDITRPGCNSELHLVDERIVGNKPETLSFEDAAALPLTTITAWEALFHRLGVKRAGSAPGAWPTDDRGGRGTILIISGAGGVGSIAIQIARQVAGLTAVATASRPESQQWCRKMGADHVINHHDAFAPQLEKIGVGEVEYVLCLNLLHEHFAELPDIMKPGGRICSILPPVEPIDTALLFQKSIGLLFELMFTRPRFRTPDMMAQHDLLCEVSRLVDTGTLHSTRTVDGGPLSAAHLREAHARVESGSMIGKLVLSGIE